MPNFVSANADSLPPLTRRRLLAGAAAVAASAVAGGVPVQAAPAYEPDAKLAALAGQFADALEAYDFAERHRNACERRFFEQRPDPPAALTQDGPLGKLLKRDWDWWSVNDLRWMLSDRARRKHWRVARMLLPLAQAHRAKVKRFERACGLPEAEAAQEAASDTLTDLTHLILALPARSLPALALKARVVKAWGKPDWWNPIDGRADPYERLAAQILDAVVGMA